MSIVKLNPTKNENFDVELNPEKWLFETIRFDNSIVNVTPQVATHLLNHFAYTKNRKMKEAAINGYMEELQSGKWIDGGFHIAVGVYPGLNNTKKYTIANGHTRLTAIRQSGCNGGFRFYLHECKNFEEFMKWYENFDSSIVNRSVGDNLGDTVDLFLGSTTLPDGELKTAMGRLGSAILITENGFKERDSYHSKTDHESVRNAIRANANFVQFMLENIETVKENNTHGRSYIMPKAVQNMFFSNKFWFSYMHFLYKYGGDLAKKFIRQLYDTEQQVMTLDPHHAVNTLISRLVDVYDKQKIKGQERESYTGILLTSAWNGFVRNSNDNSSLKKLVDPRRTTFGEEAFLKTPADVSVKEWRKSLK